MRTKVAPILLKLGYRDVTVKIEADTLFTVVGAIDSRRRWNWEMQWQAARPRLVELVDNPKTCTCTSLFITQARK